MKNKVINKVLIALGFSGLNEDEDASDNILAYIDSLRDNNKYKVITKADINQLEGVDLISAVYDNLVYNSPRDYRREFGYVKDELNESRRDVYAIWSWEGEINNGGFNQFYVNQSGQYATMLPHLLSLIGAHNFARLMSRANDIYISNVDARTKFQDGSIEGFSRSYDGNPLNKLDDEFYDMNSNEELIKYQENYIRSHIDQFT